TACWISPMRPDEAPDWPEAEWTLPVEGRPPPAAKYPAAKPIRPPTRSMTTLWPEGRFASGLDVPSTPAFSQKKNGLFCAAPLSIRFSAASVRLDPALGRLGERLVDLPLDFLLVEPVDHRDLGDDQVLRPLVHLLLAEGQGLARGDEIQGLQHVG